MKRILLLLEDYNELLYIETLLKKVGFDAMSTQKTKGLSDIMMSFHPTVLIVSETIKDLKGVDILAQQKEDRADLLGMVLLNPGSRQPAGGADAFIPKPIHPLLMLKILGEWVGFNEARLVEKIEKLGLFKNEKEGEGIKIFKGLKTTNTGVLYNPGEQEAASSDGGIVYNPEHGPTGTQGAGLKFFKQSLQQTEDRLKRFNKALQDLPSPKNLQMEKKTVAVEVKEFRARTNDAELVNIDKERKAFVDALYDQRKKSRS